MQLGPCVDGLRQYSFLLGRGFMQLGPCVGGTPPTLSVLGIKLCLVTFSIPLQFVGNYYGLWGLIEGASLIFRQPLDS
jgi:hypothetical protein